MHLFVPNIPLNTRFFAITVNWNRPTDTLACIDSLLQQTPIIPEVVVVDNGSNDDSVTQIQSQYPQVKLIANSENLGFGRGNNIGIQYALENGADYVFLINNDAVLASNGMIEMFNHTAPKVGIIAPLIYYATPPNLIWSIGGKVNPWLLEKFNDAENTIDPGNWPPVIERDFVTGCGMLISRAVLENVGAFDESFRMYYEDSDLCYRVRKAGFKILVVPAAKMWHQVSSSSDGRDTPNERYWMGRSSVLFFRKHVNGWRWLFVLPWRLGSTIKTTLRLLSQGKILATRAYIRGSWEGIFARKV